MAHWWIEPDGYDMTSFHSVHSLLRFLASNQVSLRWFCFSALCVTIQTLAQQCRQVGLTGVGGSGLMYHVITSTPVSTAYTVTGD